jgi:hypothetical protein
MAKSTRANDLAEFAIAGYAGSPNPHLYSSGAYYAHRIGEHLRESGRSAPRDVRMGRGYKVRANDMLFDGDSLERLS